MLSLGVLSLTSFVWSVIALSTLPIEANHPDVGIPDMPISILIYQSSAHHMAGLPAMAATALLHS